MQFVNSLLNNLKFLIFNSLLEFLTLELSLLIKLSTLFIKFRGFDCICFTRNIIARAFNIKHTSLIGLIYFGLILTQSQVLNRDLCLNIRRFNIRKNLFCISDNKVTRLNSILGFFLSMLCISLIVINNRISLLYLYIC